MSSGGGGFGILQPVAELTGVAQGARAAGAAGRATLEQQRADRAQALQYSEPSEMELAQLERAVQVNEQDIARRTKLLESSDPALIESGKQALQLLRGEEAKALAPIRDERSRGRQQLENSLAARLGPDYAQSSAGITALSEYDRQTGNLMTNAQQQTLGQFLGVAQNMQQFGNLQPNIGQARGIAQARGLINQRQVGALTGTRVDPGLAYAGDLAAARGTQNLTGQLIQGGAMAAGMAMGGPPGGAAAKGAAGKAMAGTPDLTKFQGMA